MSAPGREPVATMTWSGFSASTSAGGGRPAESQIDAILLDHDVEMIDDPVDFAAALDLGGDPQLATSAGSSLDQDDLVTLTCGGLGGLHAGRARSDDHDTPPERGLQQGPDAEFAFVARSWVVHARGVGDGEQSVDATLVAADTAADLVEPTLFHLVDGFGVGDLLAGHCDHVGVAEARGPRQRRAVR